MSADDHDLPELSWTDDADMPTDRELNWQAAIEASADLMGWDVYAYAAFLDFCDLRDG